jgi:hypothetical protein
MQFPCDVEYVNGVRLLGYDLAALNDGTEGPLPVESGRRLRITLYWYPTRPIADDLLVFVHVLDAAGHRLGQDDAPPVRAAYPSSAWRPFDSAQGRPGEVVTDAHDVRVLPGAPPDTYRLRVGLETPDGRALDVITGDDVVGEFPVRRPAEFPSVPVAGTIAHSMHSEFGNTLVLLGHDLEPVTVRPGDQLSFALLWQARTAPGADYGLMVYLIDLRNSISHRLDVPLSPGYPTSQWISGEIVRTPLTVVVPPEASPGAYEVKLGVRGPDGRPVSSMLWFLPFGYETELQHITVSP